MASWISIDWTLAKKDKLKAAVTALNAGLEPAITSPGNVDKAALDALEQVINAAIDKYVGSPLVIGATPTQVSTFLASYPNAPQKSKDFINAHPEAVDRLLAKDNHGHDVFNAAQREAIMNGVGGIDWLSLLMTLLPFVLKILLAIFI